MKILLAVPTVPTVSREDFVMDFSPYRSAVEAVWDNVGAEKADYIIVPYHLRAQLTDPRARPRVLLGGDVLIPFTFDNPGTNQVARRAELRSAIINTFLGAFPSYEKFPRTHVFFDTGDLDRPCPVLCDSILFKTDPNCRDLDVLSLPRPLPDPGQPYSITKAEIDVSFYGYTHQHAIRERLASWARRQTDLRAEFRSTKHSMFSTEPKRRTRMVQENFELILRSKFVLSPRGRGLGSRRFFEILAHGRIPVLVSDSYKLPLESTIDYDEFVVRVPEGFVEFTADYIREFWATHDLVEASGLARQTYVEYFAPPRFRHFIETSLATRDSRPT